MTQSFKIVNWHATCRYHVLLHRKSRVRFAPLHRRRKRAVEASNQFWTWLLPRRQFRVSFFKFKSTVLAMLTEHQLKWRYLTLDQSTSYDPVWRHVDHGHSNPKKFTCPSIFQLEIPFLISGRFPVTKELVRNTVDLALNPPPPRKRISRRGYELSISFWRIPDAYDERNGPQVFSLDGEDGEGDVDVESGNETNKIKKPK